MSVGRYRVSRTDALLLVAVAGVVAAVALAALTGRIGSVDERARDLEAQLRCPTCQGLSIADSPATSAAQMRVLVREKIAAGASDDQIRAFFAARYGRWILLDPPFGGPDLALWLAPALIVVIGATLVVRRARLGDPQRSSSRWLATSPPTPRVGTLLVAGGMVIALVVPIGGALGPRLAAGEITGGVASQTAASIEDMEAFVRAQPGDAGALVMLGEALVDANRPGDAAERFRAALELDPNNVDALLGLGTILLAADRPDGAGPAFDRVLSLVPDQPDALLLRAVARRRLEGTMTPDARRDLERFLVVASVDDPRRQMAAELLAEGPGSSPAAPPPDRPRATPP